MKNQNKSAGSSRQDGFTLIEIAVVLIIVGIVVSIVSTILPTLIQSAKIKKSEAILEKVNYAIQGYVTANNRLPFADNGTSGVEDAGTPTYFGNLPFVTLGLSSGDDAWGNRIRYGVNSNLTTTTTSTFSAALNSACTPFDPVTLHINHQAGLLTNMAYVIVSGGPRNEDGVNGFFDGRNEVDDAEYDDPDRIISPGAYDDLMRARSCTEVSGIQGIGMGTPGPPSGTTGVENTDILCSDSTDNDGDGKIDCHDQDCCGVGVTATLCPTCPPQDDVSIVTTPDPIPQAIVGQSGYSHTFQATGGSGYYFWYLDSLSPAISGLDINLWSGTFSGTIDNCAGDYTITVRAEDRYDSSKSDTHTFSLTVVNGSLSLVPAPSGGGAASPDFIVDASTYTQTFSVSGAYMGAFNWSISWVGPDPGGFQIISLGDTTAKLEKSDAANAGDYTFTLTATDSSCTDNTITTGVYSVRITAAGATAPFYIGMEAQWRFDECDIWSGSLFDVVDSLGEMNHYGRAAGSASAVHSGKICRAASFDGSDDKIVSRVLTGVEIMGFSNEVTLACWFKSPGGGGQYPRLVEFSDAAGNSNRSTALCYDNDGSLRAWVSSESGIRGGEVDFSATLYNDDQWHHAVYTYGSTNGGNLYVDGNLKDTATNNLTSDIHDAETFVIGGYYPNNSHGFRGLIDEAMVLSRELTATEVSELYQSTRTSCSGDCYADSVIGQWNMDESAWDGTVGEVQDASTNSLNGTSLNGATTTTEGKVCRAGEFTASTQAIQVPDDTLLDFDGNPFTIAFWYYLNQASTASWEQIFVKGNGSSRNYAMWMRSGSSGQILMSVDPGNQYFYSTSVLTTDTWYFINAVHENGNLDLFITESGSPLHRDSGRTVTMNGTGDNNEALYIGKSPSFDTLPARVDQFILYNRALARNELTALMGAGDACPAGIVSISTASLPDTIISGAYSATLAATGGTMPYGWELVAPNPIPGLALTTNPDYTATLAGTANVCAGSYTFTIRVTDAEANWDQRQFLMTVANGALSISPAPAPPDFTCTSSTFYQDFTVSGDMAGSMGAWNLDWIVDPGSCFELIPGATNTVRFRKSDACTLPAGSYYFQITAEDSACSGNTISSGYYGITISGQGLDAPYYSGLSAEWRMDECTWTQPGDVTDYSGGGSHGTAVNANTIDTGKICRAGSTDAASSYILLNPVVDIGSTWSIAAWFKWPLSSTGSGWWTLTRGSDDHQILVNRSSNLLGTYDNDGGRGFRNCGFDMSTLNSGWHHVVAVGHDSQTDFYIDGDLKGSADEKSTTDIRTIGNYIGGSQNWGKFDEVMLYSRALSQSDINALMAVSPACPSTGCYTDAVVAYMMEESGWTDGAPDILDAMGSYDGTAHADATTVADGGCRAGIFDGAGDYVDAAIGAIAAPFTISAWGYFENLDQPGGRYDYILKLGTAPNMVSLSRYRNGGSHPDGNRFYSYSQNNFRFGPVITGQVWHHFVLISNSTSPYLMLYIDGTEQVVDDNTAGITTNGDLRIGVWENTSWHNGMVDEVMIWDRGLSESTIENLYNAGRCN